jgi:hypothetical protein
LRYQIKIGQIDQSEGALKATKTVKKKQNLQYLHYQDTPRVDMGIKISGKTNTIQSKRFGAGLFTLH